MVVPLTVGNGTVPEPTTSPPEPKVIGVPLSMVPEPPLLKVIPPTAIIPPCSTVNVWPSVVMIAAVGLCRGIVLVPIRREPEGFNEMSVLLTVMPGPPADNVAPPTENSVEFTVKVWPPTVRMDDCGNPASRRSTTYD